MPIKTEAEIIQDIQALIDDIWGNTPLIDPAANISDPLVQSQIPAAVGLARLYQEFEKWTDGLSPLTATGEQLDLIAELMGMPRKTGVPSVVPIIFMGDCCHDFPAGTILVDQIGVEWETLDNVSLGFGGRAFVNAQSPVGAYDLDNGELRLKEPVTGVMATNAAHPDLGGEEESDEALRRRLLNIRPHWRVKGTPASIIADILSLSGVIQARVVEDLPDCLNECGSAMIAVHGGDSDEIAEAIVKNVPISPDRLIGMDSGEFNCHTVKFQRMCPVKINVRYWTSCVCERQTEEEISAAIVEKINTSIGNNDLSALARCHSDVVRVEINAERMPLAADCFSAEELIDPYTGEPISYATNKLNSLCLTGVDCGEWRECVDLADWHYAIAGSVERMKECGCSSTVSCGCK